MKKLYLLALAVFVAFGATGCGAIGEKSGAVSTIYAVCTVCAALLLLAYCCFVKKRNVYYLILFSCILIVNCGYFWLSAATSLESALNANRLAYFGSVFLLPSMLMVIAESLQLKFARWAPVVMLVIGVCVFLVAASPGILPIYYHSVSLEIIEGVAVLNKEYGPLHPLYLFYLLGYFIVIIACLVIGFLRRRLSSVFHAIALTAAVFVNIGIWLLEQLVDLHFELLSVSYIISASFLLSLCLLLQYAEKRSVIFLPTEPATASLTEREDEVCQRLEQFNSGLSELTPTERLIFECYLAGRTTAEICTQLDIKENTLKYHNKNLYGKLGVHSRKELKALAAYTKTESETK
ncbi:MAG: hypothetical protein IJE00_05180 [Clostridia bacterium]|nr:hypothetical protein [Clostridia bacterium]